MSDTSREAFEELRGTSSYLKLQLAIQDSAPQLKKYESVMLAENLAEFVWQAAQAEQAKQFRQVLSTQLNGTVMSKYASKAECEAARAALRNAMLDVGASN